MLLKLFRRMFAKKRSFAASRGAVQPSQLRTAARKAAHSTAVLLELGRKSLAMNDLAGAREAFEELLASDAENCEALILLATVQAQQGELVQAQHLLTRALALAPEHARAHDTLGNLLRASGKIEEALASYQRALELDPLHAPTLSNTGLCMRDLGRYQEARIHLERATQLDHANPVIATNLAALLYDAGDFDEATNRIEAVLAQHPDFAEAHVVRGTRLLRRGDYARGWLDYEWRDRDSGRVAPAVFEYPPWNGAPMGDGTLLVCCEQGLGDQIMFASCVPDLLRIAPRCVVECDPRLKALFARSFPQARFYVQRQRGEEMWRRDGFVPSVKTWLGSLPGQFRRQAAAFPQHAGYLVAEPEKVAAWRDEFEALGPGPKIGISWRGGTGMTRRALRSIELEEWVPLLRCPGMHFVNLQYGDCADEIERITRSSGVSIKHWESALRDYDETAALVTALDLVISVQTAVVHLAGALGKPVWVLVPSVAEWRYGDQGERMPWYPSARLYRQSTLEVWDDVLNRVRSAVASAADAPTVRCD